MYNTKKASAVSCWGHTNVNKGPFRVYGHLEKAYITILNRMLGYCIDNNIYAIEGVKEILKNKLPLKKEVSFFKGKNHFKQKIWLNQKHILSSGKRKHIVSVVEKISFR